MMLLKLIFYLVKGTITHTVCDPEYTFNLVNFLWNISFIFGRNLKPLCIHLCFCFHCCVNCYICTVLLLLEALTVGNLHHNMRSENACKCFSVNIDTHFFIWKARECFNVTMKTVLNSEISYSEGQPSCTAWGPDPHLSYRFSPRTLDVNLLIHVFEVWNKPIEQICFVVMCTRTFAAQSQEPCYPKQGWISKLYHEENEALCYNHTEWWVHSTVVKLLFILSLSSSC